MLSDSEVFAKSNASNEFDWYQFSFAPVTFCRFESSQFMFKRSWRTSSASFKIGSMDKVVHFLCEKLWIVLVSTKFPNLIIAKVYSFLNEH